MRVHQFESREQASKKAAEQILVSLRRHLDNNDSAAIVVSGGSTPERCFTSLSNAELNWQNVRVFLSDERWLPAEHPDSNEKLVRDSLLTGAANRAKLQRVFREGITIEQACHGIENEILQLSVPFASVLLGMGADGHFASLFPDFDDLATSLDLKSNRLCLPVHTAASSWTRVSLTLSAMCRSDEVLLLIFGEEKWQTLERARLSDNAYPVSRLLSQTQTPVHVYWAA